MVYGVFLQAQQSGPVERSKAGGLFHWVFRKVEVRHHEGLKQSNNKLCLNHNQNHIEKSVKNLHKIVAQGYIFCSEMGYPSNQSLWKPPCKSVIAQNQTFRISPQLNAMQFTKKRLHSSDVNRLGMECFYNLISVWVWGDSTGFQKKYCIILSNIKHSLYNQNFKENETPKFHISSTFYSSISVQCTEQC